MQLAEGVVAKGVYGDHAGRQADGQQGKHMGGDEEHIWGVEKQLARQCAVGPQPGCRQHTALNCGRSGLLEAEPIVWVGGIKVEPPAVRCCLGQRQQVADHSERVLFGAGAP